MHHATPHPCPCTRSWERAAAPIWLGTYSTTQGSLIPGIKGPSATAAGAGPGAAAGAGGASALEAEGQAYTFYRFNLAFTCAEQQEQVVQYRLVLPASGTAAAAAGGPHVGQAVGAAGAGASGLTRGPAESEPATAPGAAVGTTSMSSTASAGTTSYHSFILPAAGQPWRWGFFSCNGKCLSLPLLSPAYRKHFL